MLVLNAAAATQLRLNHLNFSRKKKIKIKKYMFIHKNTVPWPTYLVTKKKNENYRTYILIFMPTLMND